MAGLTSTRKLLDRFVREELGQDIIEYAFLAVFIGLAVVAALQAVGGSIATQFGNISSQLSSGS
jgi:Flp pilus assembly pilin Flp